MKFRDFKFTDENHFIAMEYYFLILNRTFLFIKTKDHLIGIQGSGLISAEGGADILTHHITSNMAVKGDLNNPYAYLKNKYLEKVVDLDLLDGSILEVNKTNFVLKTIDIKTVYHDPAKKTGMGPYPHDGRVMIETFDNKKRELIILGNQSGEKIANIISRNRV
jgi:hypothetical protein